MNPYPFDPFGSFAGSEWLVVRPDAVVGLTNLFHQHSQIALAAVLDGGVTAGAMSAITAAGRLGAATSDKVTRT